jgi:hypothetical protein
MIPKKIHFIYGLSEDYGKMPFSFFHWAAIKSAKKMNPDYEIYYWYKNLPNSRYMDSLINDGIIFKEIEVVPTHIFGNELCCVAHKADILRLEILNQIGGIYLDIDTITVKSFDELLDNKCVMARESIEGIVDGLCNAVILAQPQTKFINVWYDSYRTFRSRGQNPNLPNDYYVEHSVWKPLEIAKTIPDEITILPMQSFFYPDWRDESLHKLFNERLIFKDAYVHHLWESKCYNILNAFNEYNYKDKNCSYSDMLTKILESEIEQLKNFY